MSKKIIALLLALSLCAGCFAALGETVKHERVYVVTDTEGTVKSLTDTVRLENTDSLDEIVDLSMLSGIENTGSGTFTQDGQTLTWQVSGADATYQGSADKLPAVVPVITLTLNGEASTAEAIAEAEGQVEMTVSYTMNSEAPHLAATMLLLPESGVTGIELENATQMSLSTREAIIGWAVPGADEKLELPDHFTVRFTADHADLSWLMTFATADPIELLTSEIDDRVDIDAHLELDEAAALLNALKNGDALPETTSKTKDIVPKINELNDGLSKLNDGASTLADGARMIATSTDLLADGASTLADGASDLADGASTLADGAADLSDGATLISTSTDLLADGASTLADGASSLADGASSLSTGLSTLSGNSATLSDGADAIFAAILATANQQIASSGLSDAGIDVPELTADTYEAILTAALTSLDPDTLKAAASAQVEAVVRPQVEANEDQVRAGVTQAVQAQVLSAVLTAAGMQLDAETYTAAVNAGQVDSTVVAQVKAAVEAQMASEDIQATIEAAVKEQIDTLVNDNVAQYLANDETVTAKLAQAQAGYDSLNSLLTQLNQVATFVNGVKAYTAGVDQAATGASDLSDGAATLSDGAATLRDGLTSLATGASSLKNGAGTLADGAKTLADGAQTLADGAAELKDGTATLADGAGTLADGAKTLYEDGTDKLRTTMLDAEAEAAEKLLPYVEDDLTDALRIFETTRDAAKESSYDLRPDDMKTVTVYIIRTDLK